MKLLRTDSFKKDFQRLPLDIQQRAEKALRFLATNVRHPSLQVRLTDTQRRIWKANITRAYRFTFQAEEERIILRAIGNHEEMLRAERW